MGASRTLISPSGNGLVVELDSRQGKCESDSPALVRPAYSARELRASVVATAASTRKVAKGPTISATPTRSSGPLPSHSPHYHRGTPDATSGRPGRGERSAHTDAIPGPASGSPLPSHSPPVSTHELAAKRESPPRRGDNEPARVGTGAGAAILARTAAVGDCLLYTGPKNRPDGYGRTKVDGKMVYAHRVVYEAFVGPIPPGLYVCHRCDTPACIKLAHLFVGSPSDNFRDAVAKGRNAPVHGDRESRSRGGNAGGGLTHGRCCLTFPATAHRPKPGCRIVGGYWDPSGRFVDTRRRDGLRPRRRSL